MNPEPSTVLLLLAVACAWTIPMAYRMAMPTPAKDLAAVELFLKNRDEKLISIKKMWVGGPARSGGRAIYVQTGRPYQVMAQSTDGSCWTHCLAVDGIDGLGSLQLKQRLRGVWSPVIQ